ncbi:MAG: DNA recombination protein RmuC [Porticoccaceae bacterium]|nr:DNA recombination protein RmuC [Porticoccaceae bacterium]
MNIVLENPGFVFAAGFVVGGLLFALILQLRFSKASGAASSLQASQQQELDRLRAEYAQASARLEELLGANSALKATLEADRQRYQEQVLLLQETRDNLSKEFENLANRIFDEKQNNFSRQSKLALDATVDPLRKEISDFRKQVETAYTQESAERNKLVGQIQELKTQAQRIGEDAIQLTKALKGDSKMQGNWGEVILERLLEESGLSKGREYETQVNLKSEDGARRNPDVIIHLPENRDIIIDAKVSLVDYERYCREEDEAEKQRHLSRHLASIRGHISGLNRKAYEQLDGINTLDFVLIFIPIEGAFMAAVASDNSLFMDAYDRGIILVSPSTLLATLRTISNIWRYEDQNRNAQKIAAQAGSLYDQFVLVIESFDDVGKHIVKSQEAWQQTRNRLVDGRGNLVRRMDELKKMGARARKSLPDNIREEASADYLDDSDQTENDDNGES